jgi:hypothetical protein
MAHAPEYGVVADGQGVHLNGRVDVPAAWTWSFEFGGTEGGST